MGDSSKAWFSRADMARIFDCTVGNFDSRIKSYAPAECVKTEGRRVFYHARGVIDAWASQTMERTADPELAGEGSPALERFREARAALAEYELRVKQGDLMARADVHEGLVSAGVILQRKVVLLRKKFGEEASQIIADATEDMLRTNERLFGSDDDRNIQSGATQG